VTLEAATWIRFGVWMVLGLVVYFGWTRSRATRSLARQQQRG